MFHLTRHRVVRRSGRPKATTRACATDAIPARDAGTDVPCAAKDADEGPARRPELAVAVGRTGHKHFRVGHVRQAKHRLRQSALQCRGEGRLRKPTTAALHTSACACQQYSQPAQSATGVSRPPSGPGTAQAATRPALSDVNSVAFVASAHIACSPPSCA
eukprot:scaffold370_cov289-Prasinococcus_capsulatus_cf.AAC.6